MPQVAVTKVNDSEKKTLPVFAEIAKRLARVQRRAFDLFEKRGGELGHELEDWFKAEHELFDWPAAELTEKMVAMNWRCLCPASMLTMSK